MSQVLAGKVKAWELNSESGTIGVCIPKIVIQNLNLEKGTFFEVSFNIDDRKVTLTPLESQKEGHPKKRTK